MSRRVTPEDAMEMAAITFEWGDSYDTKDWDRLRRILAPELVVDYSDVIGKKWDSMTAEDFVTFVSDPNLLGDSLVHTQHFIGGSKYNLVFDDLATGIHQIRAAHQRYTGPDKQTVESKGHGHAVVSHTYRKIGGEWKLAGIKPSVYWNEFDFDKVFPRLG
ncbi:Scytalone dehydratase [Dactylonectria macrodidyma]|uniref:Scytalone dehydratase n=1 Tax=Dactylonectria macrodidyma TaxID=307937 RepID=A0A9P9IUF3_9HYPO|nr:Scytalone dehydratase [Dactylonectria macrodidyma]